MSDRDEVRAANDRRNYIAAELANVNTNTPECLRLSIRNPDFSPGTKWINISQAQFKEIERILTLGNEW